jgi:hypothetical protein
VLSPSKSAVLAVLLAALPLTPVLATNQADHRYDVRGYILDADRQPIPGVMVVARVDGKLMGSGRSDSNGYYQFRMHLHNSSLGRELRLKTPEYQGTVRISFEPGDASAQRLHYANFIDGKLVEGKLAGRGGFSTTLLTTAAGAAILLASYFVARHSRRLRRRRQRAEQKAANPRSGSSPKRTKRKKRRR